MKKETTELISKAERWPFLHNSASLVAPVYGVLITSVTGDDEHLVNMKFLTVMTCSTHKELYMQFVLCYVIFWCGIVLVEFNPCPSGLLHWHLNNQFQQNNVDRNR